jgi:hypothetical protein
MRHRRAGVHCQRAPAITYPSPGMSLALGVRQCVCGHVNRKLGGKVLSSCLFLDFHVQFMAVNIVDYKRKECLFMNYLICE